MSTSTLKRAAIYLRISKHDPNVPKVENQEALCRALAEHFGYEVVAVYTDDGISASRVGKAKTKARPDWIKLLDDVRAKKFDVLLAQAEDRFSREPMEKEVLDDLCAESGITYHTHADGETDPSKASGRLGSGIKALVARYYVATASEKHRDSNAALRAKGLPMPGGDRPFGFEKDKITHLEPEAGMVRQALHDVAAGLKSPTVIARDWNAGIATEGRDYLTWVRSTRGKAWTAPSVKAVLERPRNIGMLQHDDGEARTLTRAAWEPLVEEEIYAAAMRVLAARKSGRVHPPKHLMAGIATCATCGKNVAANSNGRGAKYRCWWHNQPGKVPTPGHVEINTSILDEVVTEAVVAAVLFAPRSKVTDPDAATLRELRGRLLDLAEQKARLVKAVQLGALEPEDVAQEKRGIDAESSSVEEEVAAIAALNAQADLLADVSLFLTERTPLADAAKARATVRERFEAMSLGQRQALVRGMLDVEVTPGGRGAGRVRVTHKVATGLNEAA